MPNAYRIDPARALVLNWSWGELTEAEILGLYRSIGADPAFNPTFGQLIDLRDVRRVDAPAATFRKLARSDPFARSARRSIAAPAAEPFGLGRMFATYAEAEGKRLGIFRTVEGAEDWLNLPRGTVDELRRAPEPEPGPA